MTLRIRIIVLITLFATFLIAGFAAIQVFNQLDMLNDYNSYRVRMGANSAKTSLEFRLALHQAQHPGEDPLPELKAELTRLHEGGLFDRAALLSREGETLFTLGDSWADAQDQRWGPYAVTIYSKERWLYSSVTPAAVHAFVPLIQQQQPRLVVRLTFVLANMRQAIQTVYQLSLLMALGVLVLSALFGWFLTHAILNPIQVLYEATRDIAAGNIALKVHVATGDELEELAMTFNEMTDALVKFRARAENANPLTKLPGNNVIREEIDRRITAKTLFVVVYGDLDNFKAFNDKYGIGQGDEAIKLTAKILREALKLGNRDDFVGHEGGDDFVLITTPEKVDVLTQFIGTEFDQRVRALYPADDLAKGKFTASDREGNLREFPIMTLSMAGATNAHRPLQSYAEVTNVLAEVKKKAKLTSAESGKSSLVVDRRQPQSAAPAPPTPSAGPTQSPV